MITVSFVLSDLKRELPEKIIIHLPHPDGSKAQKVSKGIYDQDNETIVIDDFSGEINLQVNY